MAPSGIPVTESIPAYCFYRVSGVEFCRRRRLLANRTGMRSSDASSPERPPPPRRWRRCRTFRISTTPVKPHISSPRSESKHFFLQPLNKLQGPRVRAVMVGSGKRDRVGNGSGRERESRVYFVPDRKLPTPSRPWSYIPTVRRPNSRRLVPVPTVSRPAVRCFPEFSRPAVRPVVLIPSRRSHTVSPIPQLTVVADVPIPSYHRLYFFSII